MFDSDLVAPRQDGPGDQLLSSLSQTVTVVDNELVIAFAGISVRLQVDASPGCGGLAWPAGQILASYLVHRGPAYLQGKNILELGSGTGLVGLVAGALAQANVVITDQADLVPIMERNVVLNDLQHRVTVAELDWAAPIASTIARPDLILAADCVYFEPAFPLLVQTLSDLAGLETEVLFAYKKRRKADKRFFTMLRKSFTWTEVADDPNHAAYAREAITFLRLSKVKNATVYTRPT